jgi:hypothetical protein
LPRTSGEEGGAVSPISKIRISEIWILEMRPAHPVAHLKARDETSSVKGEASMAEEVSVMRLYVLRGMYLVNFVLVGGGVWVQFVRRPGPWDPIIGTAFSFWAALSILSALGLRYPVAMLPIIFMQLCYKVFWFPLAYFPLRAAGRSSDLAPGFLIGIALDLVVIPWTHVYAHYIKKTGDPWARLREPASQR